MEKITVNRVNGSVSAPLVPDHYQMSIAQPQSAYLQWLLEIDVRLIEVHRFYCDQIHIRSVGHHETQRSLLSGGRLQAIDQRTDRRVSGQLKDAHVVRVVNGGHRTVNGVVD